MVTFIYSLFIVIYEYNFQIKEKFFLNTLRKVEFVTKHGGSSIIIVTTPSDSWTHDTILVQTHYIYIYIYIYVCMYVQGKVIPLQARCGPEGIALLFHDRGTRRE